MTGELSRSISPSVGVYNPIEHRKYVLRRNRVSEQHLVMMKDSYGLARSLVDSATPLRFAQNDEMSANED